MTLPSYIYLRPVAIIAGTFGIFQALVWISFSITGIVAYHCQMDFSGESSNLGSILKTTIYLMYFHGPCSQPDLPFSDVSQLTALNITTPNEVYAWMWVYMSLNLIWLICSITLITDVRKKNMQNINIYLYLWILMTLLICIIDLAVGTLFGLDYNAILAQAYGVKTDEANVNQYVLITGQTASAIMMVMAFKGFIFWILNIAFASYLFTQTFKVNAHIKMKSGTTNEGFSEAPHSLQSNKPIDAYGYGFSTRILPTNDFLRQPSIETSSEWSRPPSVQPVNNYTRQQPIQRGSNFPPPVPAEVPSNLSRQPSVQFPKEVSRKPSLQIQPEIESQPPVQIAAVIPRPPPIQAYSNPPPAPPPMIEKPYVKPPTKPRPPPNPKPAKINIHKEAANAGKERYYRNYPAPDYSPPMPRVNPFENRPPLKSPLRNSGYQ